MQAANKVLMVRPAHFCFNAETAENNYFQEDIQISDLHRRVLKEFDNFVDTLRSNGIDVVVVQDTLTPHTPDSIFPNNWFSTHSDGLLVLYPMFAKNRQLERKPETKAVINSNFNSIKVIDLTSWENKDKYLEGTGSIIFDHEHRIAYACKSLRTNENLFYDFCKQIKFVPVFFEAIDINDNPIYHTNVMLSIGSKTAVICSQSIKDIAQREHVWRNLIFTNKEIVDITFYQMNQFCANVIEVKNRDDISCLIMSESARKAFTSEQLASLQKHCKIISSPLDCIEQVGGGSARCMIAELFENNLKYSI